MSMPHLRSLLICYDACRDGRARVATGAHLPTARARRDSDELQRIATRIRMSHPHFQIAIASNPELHGAIYFFF